MKNNCKIQIKEFRIKKVMKKKGEILHMKWKGYDNFLKQLDR